MTKEPTQTAPNDSVPSEGILEPQKVFVVMCDYGLYLDECETKIRKIFSERWMAEEFVRREEEKYNQYYSWYFLEFEIETFLEKEIHPHGISGRVDLQLLKARK